MLKFMASAVIQPMGVMTPIVQVLIAVGQPPFTVRESMKFHAVLISFLILFFSGCAQRSQWEKGRGEMQISSADCMVCTGFSYNAETNLINEEKPECKPCWE